MVLGTFAKNTNTRIGAIPWLDAQREKQAIYAQLFLFGEKCTKFNIMHVFQIILSH
jgi:hypothetical protein